MKKAAKKTVKNRAGTVGLVLFALACLAVMVVSTVRISDIQAERTAARREYEHLREYAPTGPAESVAGGEAESLLHLLEINADFVGWLSIPGTDISYPVVQGADNDKYLRTTFEGERNEAGAVFMDCGVAEQFESRHVILYGHNMKDGTMFAGLAAYLDAGFLAEHPEIEVTLPDGAQRTYRIFAARKTDAGDAAYRVGFADDSDFTEFAQKLGSPQGAGHLLTLSTCTSGGEDVERIVVHARLMDLPVGA